MSTSPIAVLRVNTSGPLYPTSQFVTFTYPYIGEMWTSGGDVLGAGLAVLWAARLLGLFSGDASQLAQAMTSFARCAGSAGVSSLLTALLPPHVRRATQNPPGPYAAAQHEKGCKYGLQNAHLGPQEGEG